jgi:hypothetical protein
VLGFTLIGVVFAFLCSSQDTDTDPPAFLKAQIPDMVEKWRVQNNYKNIFIV